MFHPWVGKIPLEKGMATRLGNFTDRGAWRTIIHGEDKELDRTE